MTTTAQSSSLTPHWKQHIEEFMRHSWVQNSLVVLIVVNAIILGLETNQVMTLEGWSHEIARPIMEIYPYAWVFFISFILIATFIIFNLFIAVIVDSITANKEKDVRDEVHLSNIKNNLSAMRDEISELKRMLEKR